MGTEKNIQEAGTVYSAMGPVEETFPIISEEPEIRVMGIIMQALKRHLLPNGETFMEKEMEPARRVVRYIASRIGA